MNEVKQDKNYYNVIIKYIKVTDIIKMDVSYRGSIKNKIELVNARMIPK